MRNIAALLLGIVFLFSCNSKNENRYDTSGYGVDAVGAYQEGKYVIKDIEAIKIKWGEAVQKEMQVLDMVHLEEFLIEKTAVQGSESKECYLLTAKNNDKKITVGALLVLKNNEFYLDTKNMGGELSTGIVICKGSCGDISCSPVVLSRGQELILICSSCRDCSKTVTEVDIKDKL